MVNSQDVTKPMESVRSEEAVVESDDIPDRPLTELELKIVEAVTHFNVTVVDASKRFEVELGRKNYVTSTLFLELLRSFKTLYTKKYSEIITQRDRYKSFS